MFDVGYLACTAVFRVNRCRLRPTEPTVRAMVPMLSRQPQPLQRGQHTRVYVQRAHRLYTLKHRALERRPAAVKRVSLRVECVNTQRSNEACGFEKEVWFVFV